MVTIPPSRNGPAPNENPAVEPQSLRGLDQWVRTTHNNVAAIGRIVAILQSQDNEILYEVELPLLVTHHGRMTHVARRANELHSLGCQTVEGIDASD